MRHTRFLLLGLLALGALLSSGDTGGVRVSHGSTPGVVDIVAIDARPYNVGGNTATYVGFIDQAGESSGVPVGATTEIDIVVDEVDPSDGLSGFGADLWYDNTVLSITGYDDEFLLNAAGPRMPTTDTDSLPDSDGDFRFDSGDLSTNFEDGEGVLARITVECVSVGVSLLVLDDVAGGDGVPDILDAGGAPLPVNSADDAAIIGCGQSIPSYSDVRLVQETVVGPEVATGGTGDYAIEMIAYNNGSHDFLDAEITTQVAPPAECDAGSGAGNLHTIVTSAPGLPLGVEVAMDIPFQVQCSVAGDYDFQIWNEIQPPDPIFNPDPNPDDNSVAHDVLPGAPPPLTLTPAISPGPALRVTATECPIVPLWFVPVGDDDCDGFTTDDENYLGTDPIDPCADLPDADDEGPPDMWPVDFNDDQSATMQDVIFAFVTTLAPDGLNQPAVGPLVRVDFNGDGTINMQDVILGYVTKLAPAGLNVTCAP